MNLRSQVVRAIGLALGVGLPLVITGCGGGGGGGEAKDNTPPLVSSVTPAVGATGVEPASSVTVVFSEAMDCTSITATSFTLKAADNMAVEGRVACSGNSATLTPVAALGHEKQYTARVSGAKDAAGNALASEYTWDFTVRARRWNAESVLESGAGDAYAQDFAFDANGNAVAVWSQSDGTIYHILARRYTAGVGWGATETIESDTNGAYSPFIASDSQGNALVLWFEQDGLWANSVSSTGTWGTATLVAAGGPFGNGDVAMDSAGNAMVVWSQHDGTTFNLHAISRSAAGAWGAATLIESTNGSMNKPQVVLDASGNALAVWEATAASSHIMANRFTAGPNGGWGTAEYIGLPSNNEWGLRLAIDPEGNATAIWYDDGGYIRYNRYVAGTGWGTATTFPNIGSGKALRPEIVVNRDGSAIAVWEQEVSLSSGDIWSSRYTPSSGWSTAEQIDSGNGRLWLPRIAVDAQGRAIAVWTQSDGTRFNLTANHYTPGQGWGSAATIESSDLGDVDAGVVHFDASGNALVLWNITDSNARNDILFSRFD